MIGYIATINLPPSLKDLHNIDQIEIFLEDFIPPNLKMKNGDCISTLKFPVNISESNIQYLKDWYELNWNNEIEYKSCIIGNITVDKFLTDNGHLLERMTLYNVRPFDSDKRDFDILFKEKSIDFLVDYLII